MKKRSTAPVDVVGVELSSADPRGCPAVRLVRGKSGLSVRAVGFVPPPKGSLPNAWSELGKQPIWSLPSAFSAPCAALAVDSPDAVARQTTRETLTDGNAGKNAPRLTGEPISQGGLRYALASLGDAQFVLQAGLPEYQVLWLSRLLPEGKRPTACSVQTCSSAMLASLVEQPSFDAAGGNAAALFVTDRLMYFVGFRNGRPVLFREFPGVGGLRKIDEALTTGFGMKGQALDAVLDDTLIDPSPILGPIVNPILRQMELSIEYLKSRLGVTVDKVFLMGLRVGARHWSRMSEQMLNVPLVAPDLFDGVEVPARSEKGVKELLKRSHMFMFAYGAARAAMEEAE